MKEKPRIIVVTHCLGCPWMEPFPACCRKANRKTLLMKEDLPDWCPLPKQGDEQAVEAKKKAIELLKEMESACTKAFYDISQLKVELEKCEVKG